MNLFEKDLNKLNHKIVEKKQEILVKEEEKKNKELEKNNLKMEFYNLSDKIAKKTAKIKSFINLKNRIEVFKKNKKNANLIFWIVLIITAIISLTNLINIVFSGFLYGMNLIINSLIYCYSNYKIGKVEEKINEISLKDLYSEINNLEKKRDEKKFEIRVIEKKISLLNKDLQKLKDELSQVEYEYNSIFDLYEGVKNSVSTDENDFNLRSKYMEEFPEVATKIYTKSTKDV